MVGETSVLIAVERVWEFGVGGAVAWTLMKGDRGARSHLLHILAWPYFFGRWVVTALMR